MRFLLCWYLPDDRDRSISGWASGARGLALQHGAECVQQGAHTSLAYGRIVKAFEEGALFGEYEAGAGPLGLELHRRQRDGDQRLVEGEVVGEDDAPVLHDLVVAAVEDVDGPARRATPARLAPANAEVERVLVGSPLLGAREPADLGRGIGEGGEDPR